MKKLVLVLLVLFSLNVFSASYWVNNPVDCPTTDATNFPGQSCSPNDICGDDGGTAQCYDTSTMPAPPNDVNQSSAISYTSSWDGGFVLNCYASVDASAPFCDNGGNYWCDYNSYCWNTRHMTTQCEAGVWAGGTGASTCAGCRSGWQECDGSIQDADGCEIQTNVTPYPNEPNAVYDSSCNPACSGSYLDCDGDLGSAGTGCEILDGGSCGTNAVYDGCSGGAGNCVCQTNYYDCDGSGPNAGNGCEVLDNSACTTEYGTAGTWDGPSCTCVGDKSYFETGTNTQYGTATDENFFWGTMWGTTGWMAILQNATTDKNFRIDVNANVFADGNFSGNCFIFGDGTSQCTKASASGGVSDGNVYSIGIMSKDSNAFLVDLNMNNKDIQNVNDVNVLGDLNANNILGYNPTSDLNLFYARVGLTDLVDLVLSSDFNVLYARLNVAGLHEFVYSADFNSAYATVNRALSLMGLDADFNSLYARIGITNLSDFLFDSDFNSTYAKTTQDLIDFTLSSDFNSVYLDDTDTNWQTSWSEFDANLTSYYYRYDNNAPLDLRYPLRSDWTTIDDFPAGCSAGQFVTAIGDTLTCSLPSYTTDTNIFVQGSYDSDTNSWNIDFNVGGNNIFNVKDLNITGDANFSGNLYVGGNLTVDGNITASLPNKSEITIAPDQNLMQICPNGAGFCFCMWTEDVNGIIGTC
jgi:hypothetical protein